MEGELVILMRELYLCLITKIDLNNPSSHGLVSIRYNHLIYILHAPPSIYVSQILVHFSD